MAASYRVLSISSSERFCPGVSIGQSAISRSVRLQPRHQSVRWSIRQVLSQGEGGARIAVLCPQLAQHGKRGGCGGALRILTA